MIKKSQLILIKDVDEIRYKKLYLYNLSNYMSCRGSGIFWQIFCCDKRLKNELILNFKEWELDKAIDKFVQIYDVLYKE